MNIKLQPISSSALTIFTALVKGLVNICDSKTINNSEVFLPAHIELIHRVHEQYELYSIAHYILVHDDMVPDPDVVFMLMSNGSVCPINFQNSMGMSQPVRWTDNGILRVEAREQADLAAFSNMFLANIAEQQGIEALKVSQ